MFERPQPGRGGEERYVRQEVLVDGTSEALYGTRAVCKNAVRQVPAGSVLGGET